MTDAEDFAGRRALITGAGDGIGRALARALAARGAKVAVVDLRADAARTVADHLGEGPWALAADVSDRDSLLKAEHAVQERWEGLDLLWINAGVGAGATIASARPSAVEWVYGVNVLGAIWTVQAFLPMLRCAQGFRAVGVTASSAALTAPEGLTLYAASKHATLAVGEALRSELRPEGIGVTLFCPGLLNTNIWDAARARPDRFGGPRSMDAATGQTWRAARTPEAAVERALAVMAAGGGYAMSDITPETFTQLEERCRALIEAVRAGA